MIKNTRLSVIPLFLLLFLLSASLVSAEYTTDKEAFLTEYPGLQNQDFAFSPVPVGAVIICSEFLDSTTNDQCANPGDILPELLFTTDSFGNDPLAMAGVNANGRRNPQNALTPEFGSDNLVVQIEPGAANVVGVQIGCFSSGQCERTALVESFSFNNVVVGSIEVPVTDEFNTFVGIVRSDISRIEISDANGLVNQVFGVDTVYFGEIRNVPTMSEWGVIATVAGLALIGFVVIRRRQKAYN